MSCRSIFDLDAGTATVVSTEPLASPRFAARGRRSGLRAGDMKVAAKLAPVRHEPRGSCSAWVPRSVLLSVRTGGDRRRGACAGGRGRRRRAVGVPVRAARRGSHLTAAPSGSRSRVPRQSRHHVRPHARARPAPRRREPRAHRLPPRAPPTLDPSGTWSIELPALAPGSYRAVADFVVHRGPALALGVDLSVAGEYRPTARRRPRCTPWSTATTSSCTRSKAAVVSTR